MATTFDPAPRKASRAIIAGWVLGGLALAFLALDAGGKLFAPQVMIANSPPLGLAPDPSLYRLIGMILLIGIVLHLWRRTAFVGAVWISAFLGGAVALNVRAGMPLFGNTLFGVYIGLLLWTGFWLRDPRVRAVIA